jgi:hypothetical protein
MKAAAINEKSSFTPLQNLGFKGIGLQLLKARLAC